MNNLWYSFISFLYFLFSLNIIGDQNMQIWIYINYHEKNNICIQNILSFPNTDHIRLVGACSWDCCKNFWQKIYCHSSGTNLNSKHKHDEFHRQTTVKKSCLYKHMGLCHIEFEKRCCSCVVIEVQLSYIMAYLKSWKYGWGHETFASSIAMCNQDVFLSWQK